MTIYLCVFHNDRRMRMLGSIDANTGSPDLGWDTDQFPMDVKAATMIMKTVIEQVSSPSMSYVLRFWSLSLSPHPFYVMATLTPDLSLVILHRCKG